MLVGHYHMVAFTLNSLGVPLEPGLAGFERVSDGRLAGRRILVVGAGTQPSEDIDAPPGNGRAISVRAAQEGASVICADRDRGAAEETVAWVEREASAAATVIAADITDEEDCQAMVSRGRGRRPRRARPERRDRQRPRPRPKPAPRTGTWSWRPTSAATSCAPARRSRAWPKGGSIVFISSIAGLSPGSRIPAYDASKAGLIGLCRTPPSRELATAVAGQRGRARADRHPARVARLGRAVPRASGPRSRWAARARRGRSPRAVDVPALRRGELHHRARARRRRRPRLI